MFLVMQHNVGETCPSKIAPPTYNININYYQNPFIVIQSSSEVPLTTAKFISEIAITPLSIFSMSYDARSRGFFQDGSVRKRALLIGLESGNFGACFVYQCVNTMISGVEVAAACVYQVS
jgi:hypothetical protein